MVLAQAATGLVPRTRLRPLDTRYAHGSTVVQNRDVHSHGWTLSEHWRELRALRLGPG